MVQSEAATTLDERRFVATDDDLGTFAEHAEPVERRGFCKFLVVINEGEEDCSSASFGIIGVNLEMRRDRDPCLVEWGVGEKFVQEHITRCGAEVGANGDVPDLHPGEALYWAHSGLWAEDSLDEGSIREDGGGCKQARKDKDKVAGLRAGPREATLQDLGGLSKFCGEEAL